jgi:hypothetical protein
MLHHIYLSVCRWLALRSFPRGAPRSSYVFFDYYVPYGGLHDRIMIYENNGRVFSHLFSSDFFSNKKVKFSAELTPVDLDNLFKWVSDKFPNFEKMLLGRRQTDAPGLKLFAFDAKKNWRCSILASDANAHEELIGIRDEMMEKAKRIVSNSSSEEKQKGDILH